MALFGSLATVRRQLALTPAFEAGLAYVEACLTAGSPEAARIGAMQAGDGRTVELANGVFAMEQAYVTRPRAEGRWEAHKRYIDIQLIVGGEELMEVADVGTLVVTEDLTPAKDVLFFAEFDRASVLRVGAGELTVFFPVDAHMPCVRVGGEGQLVRKTVVKVPVDA